MILELEFDRKEQRIMMVRKYINKEERQSLV